MPTTPKKPRNFNVVRCVMCHVTRRADVSQIACPDCGTELLIHSGRNNGVWRTAGGHAMVAIPHQHDRPAHPEPLVNVPLPGITD